MFEGRDMAGPGTLASLGDIMQLAFVPSDFDAAVRHWTEVMGAGPFFLLPNVSLPGGRYRGVRTPNTFHPAATMRRLVRAMPPTRAAARRKS